MVGTAILQQPGCVPAPSCPQPPCPCLEALLAASAGFVSPLNALNAHFAFFCCLLRPLPAQLQPAPCRRAPASLLEHGDSQEL